ncbi:MAG: transglycosylase domain-containing protein [Prevotella sp.]|jgi:penicillin-binding protein 1A|nr:transglycosylase domain-containing protein [Prevotella sp.]
MKKLINVLKATRQQCTRFWNFYKGCFKGRPWYIKTLSTIASVVVLFLLYLGAVDMNLFWLFGKSPGWAEISEHRTSEASELYSADGVLLGKYFNENRTPVEFNEVNPMFWKALIDTEDERFYSHWGIDPMGLLGAVKDAATGAGARGASTITQQLAKNMFRTRTNYSTGLLGKVPGVKMLIMKTKEWITAMKLELYFACTMGRKAGKDEILVQYANTVDFGHNAYGIKTAAKTYFNCLPKDLTVEQAAVLVGMLKATTFYNPISHPDNALARRNVVLENMRNHDDLTAQEYVDAKNTGIDVSEFNVEDNYDGQAKYFREAVAKYIKQLSEEDERLEGIDLYSDGLKIYTTLDTKMQRYAEEAARKHMKIIQQRFNDHWRGMQPWQDENHNVIPHFIEDIAKQQPVYQYLTSKYNGNQDSIDYYLNKPHTVKVFDYEKGEVEKEMSTMDSIRYMVSFMHCAFVAMEPQTGYVKAWVGDIDFDHWKYDKVTAMRQPGSTFKLFVYTEAMEQGLTPCDKRRDEYFQMEVWDKKEKKNVIWRPTNSDGHFTGDSMPLRAAFARSVNSVAVRLGQEMGIKNIIETAHNMGIKSPLEDAPSLALGSSDVTLLELTNAYSCIANNGRAHERAILITKIVDRKGNVIYEAPTETKQAVTEKTAFLMQQILHAGVTEGYATSQPLWKFVMNYPDCEFGGKTGTSNNHSDAWFVATSPKLVCATWVGGEYRCIHFRTGQLGQGSRAALPLCGYFIEKVLADPTLARYHGKYEKPKDGDISRGMYECSYNWVSRSDTLDVDSLGTGAVMYDEEGNPITPAPTEKEGNPQQENASAATEQSGENL